MQKRSTKSSFEYPRRRAILASAVAVAVVWPSIALAQADQFQVYFNQATATAGAPIGGFDYDVPAGTFYVGGFTTSGSLRKVTGSGVNWTGQTQVGSTDWVAKFLNSSSVTDNGGNGTVLDSTYSASTLLGDIQLNPQPITIAGINYPARSVAIMVDSSTVRQTPGNVLQPQFSKEIYAYDLRQVGAAAAPGSRDRNANGVVDWNDVFDPIVTIADMQTVQGGVPASAAPNIGRRFAYSSSGQSIYFSDSQSNFGGLWKANLTLTGAAALTKIVDSRSAGTSLITEPAVVATSVRDFGAGAGSGDQVFFRGTTDTGNIGGLNYVVDTGSSISTTRIALSAKQLAGFLDTTGAAADITSINSDASGNLYFASAGSAPGAYLYDTAGRIVKLASEAERRLHAKNRGASYNASVLDTKVRDVPVTLPDTSVVTLPHVFYSDAGAGLVTPVGITVFKPGDFNRDNVVNATDIADFKTKLGLRGVVVASIATAVPNAEVNSGNFKYDLNGSNTVAGIAGVAIDWRDVKIFQQFAGLSDGDVDMDFDVDSTDLTTLANNYNTDGKLFTQGNLTSVRIANADKDAVNYADLVTLAANWTAANPNLSGFSAAFQADADRAFAITAGGSRHQYIAKGNGAWSNAANWTNGVPNGAGDVANLLTKPQNDVMLTVDGVFTVGQLNFDNFFNYTLTGGGALLMTGANGTNAQINTFAASPTIAAPVGINSNTDVAVTYAGDTLTLSGPLLNTTGRTLTKNGAGRLTISSTQTHGAGATLVVNAGTVDLNSNAGTGGANLVMNIGAAGAVNFNAGQDMANITNNGALNVNAGNSVVGTIDGTGNFAVATPATISAERYRQSLVTINGTASVIANGTNTAVSVIDQLFLPGTGKLDLNDNDLIVSSSTYGAITSEIASARNGGLWDGAGITSTAAKNAAPKNKTLGTVTGAQLLGTGVTTFGGISVSPSDVLVKFTWYGDTDFNGVINFDDYNRTDAGFNTGGTDWFHGDFDYSDTVNFDDYALIDLAFNTQSGTLRRAMSYLDGGDRSENGMDAPGLQIVVKHFAQFGNAYASSFLNAVPEPSSALIFGGLAASAAGGRRRRQRS